MRLYDHHDYEYINQWRVNRAIDDAKTSASAGVAAGGCIFLCAFCAYYLPTSFVGFSAFNLKIAGVFLVLGAVLALISRYSGVHIDPAERAVNRHPHDHS